MRDQVKVLVGGAPVSEETARDVKADGYAANAILAVDLVKKMVQGCIQN